MSLPFGKFWAHISKTDKVQAYLDTVLTNIRKVNDTYKLQVLASSGGMKKSKDNSDGGMMIEMIGTSSGCQARSFDVVEHL